MATRGDHARAIAVACNNFNPNNTIIYALVGWSMRESGGEPRPGNNMLSSGQKEVGSTDFNPAGVQNYLTIGQEGSAVATNLSENFAGYAQLKAAIAGGYWDSSVVQGLITWVGHDAYGSDYASFIADGQAHFNDEYGGSPLVFGTGTNQTSGTGGQGGSTTTDPLTKIAQILASLATPIVDSTQFIQSLSNLAKDPIRIMKFVIGLGVLGVGLLMVFVDVIEVVSNSQPVQAIKKTAVTVGKVAA